MGRVFDTAYGITAVLMNVVLIAISGGFALLVLLKGNGGDVVISVLAVAAALWCARTIWVTVGIVASWDPSKIRMQ